MSDIARDVARRLLPYSTRGWLRSRRDSALYASACTALGILGRRAVGASVESALLARAAERRLLSASGKKPSVAAFGFAQWEKYGLWPSFADVAEFRFFDLRDVSADAGIRTVGPKQRERLADACLEVIDDADRKLSIDMVFFYADTECLSPRLFEELGRRGIWTVLMGLDDKKRLVTRREAGMSVGGLTVSASVDLMWTTWRAGTPLITASGGRAWYAPEAADPRFHKPVAVERDIEVLFVGQRYGRRTELVRRLREAGFSVSAFGREWPSGPLSFESSVQMMSRAHVVLGIGDVLGLDGVQHLKGRDFEAPMCGAAYLTTFNPELADWFSVGDELLCYSSVENCIETLSWLLRTPAKLEQVRVQGRDRCLREHTWERRLRDLLALFPKAGRGE